MFTFLTSFGAWVLIASTWAVAARRAREPGWRWAQALAVGLVAGALALQQGLGPVASELFKGICLILLFGLARPTQEGTPVRLAIALSLGFALLPTVTGLARGLAWGIALKGAGNEVINALIVGVALGNRVLGRWRWGRVGTALGIAMLMRAGQHLVVELGVPAALVLIKFAELSLVLLLLKRLYDAGLSQDVQALGQSTALRVASAASRRALVLEAERQRLPAGAALIRRGQPVPELIAVLSGQVEPEDGADDPTQPEAAAAGSLPGLRALLREAPADTTLRTVERSLILRIPREALLRVAAGDPALAEALAGWAGLASAAPLLAQAARAEGQRRVDLILTRAFSCAPLFAGLSTGEITAVASAAKIQDLPAGAVLIREGKAVRALGILLEGGLRIEKDGRWRDEGTPGDFIGEIGLLTGAVAGHTVIASTACRVAWLRLPALEAFVGLHPRAGLSILEVLVSRLPRGADRPRRAFRRERRIEAALSRLERYDPRSVEAALARTLVREGLGGAEVIRALARAAEAGGDGPGWRIDTLGLSRVPAGSDPGEEPWRILRDEALCDAFAHTPCALSVLARHALFALSESKAIDPVGDAVPDDVSFKTGPTVCPCKPEEVKQMFPLIKGIRLLAGGKSSGRRRRRRGRGGALRVLKALPSMQPRRRRRKGGRVTRVLIPAAPIVLKVVAGRARRRRRARLL